MSIQEHLNKIRNAIFGSEVRESIAKGIETAYDDASENGNANMEVRFARGTHPTLRDRLNEVDDIQQRNTTQLAQKANEEDVFLKQLGININDLDEPTRETFLNAQGIDVNYILGKENVKKENIMNNAVDEKHIDFLDVGKNLFDSKFIDGYIGGDIANGGRFNTSSNSKSAILKVKPNTTYTIIKEKFGNRFRVATHSNIPKDNETLDNFHKDQYVDSFNYPYNLEGYSFFEVTTAPTDNFMIVTVSIEGEEPFLMISEGGVPKKIEPYKLTFKKNVKFDGSVEADFIQKGKNLFNGEYVKGFITGSIADGFVDFIFDERYRSAIIPIKPSTTYTISKTVSTRFRVSTAKGTPLNNTTMTFHKDGDGDGDGETEFTFTSGDDDSLLIIYTNAKDDDSVPDFMQVEEGSVATVWETFGYKFEPQAEQVQLEQGNNNEENALKLKLKMMYGDDFEDYSSGGHFIEMNRQNDHTFIYEQYDSMLGQHMTKELLAKTTNGNDINLYRIKTHSVKTVRNNLPKILLIGGIHGHEKQSVYGAVRVFKDMMGFEKQSLNFILANFEILIVPVLNPDGYDLNQRQNGNNVDLARNFPSGYSYNPDESSWFYGGTHANSEIETQTVLNLLEDNKDLLLIIDQHNAGTFDTDQQVVWIGSGSSRIREMATNFGQYYNTKVRSEFPLSDDIQNHNDSLVDVKSSVVGGSVMHQVGSEGLNGFILESIRSLDDSIEETQRLNADILGNVLLSFVRNREFLLRS